MLLLVTEGTLHHTVDFAELALGPGSLLFVHPGQVQQWQLDPPVQGCMVMIDPPALLPTREARGYRDTLLMAMEDWPVGTLLDESAASELREDLKRLEQDIHAYDASPEDTVLIRMQLAGIMLRVARWHRVGQHRSALAEAEAQPRQARDTRDPRDVYRLFRRELEQRFREPETVAGYARRLGFSESTLNRACQSATGQTAKVLIDRRVALEAARLMAHSDATSAEVGHALGFSEPTNFVRFFVRMIGTTPARFRLTHGRGAAPHGMPAGRTGRLSNQDTASRHSGSASGRK